NRSTYPKRNNVVRCAQARASCLFVNFRSTAALQGNIVALSPFLLSTFVRRAQCSYALLCVCSIL
ncbi:unnamed protein product, partial [Citrullus colocynthis]